MENWSTDSDDEEMRKPTHGALFVASQNSTKKNEPVIVKKKVPESKIGGSCFMVKSVPSE